MDTILFFISNHITTTLIFIFIFGAVIGSFLNMVIYRYPLMLERQWQAHGQQPTEKLNLCLPRSHCPHCKKTITWWMNIPLLSFLFLRGHCFFCKQSIGICYFITEIIAAISTVIVFLHFGLTLQTIEMLIFTYGLITLSFIDLKHRILPDSITLSLLWLGLIVSTQHIFIAPTEAIFGAIVGYLFLWVISTLYLFIRKKEGMGLGDCKMLAMMGAWVGSIALLNVILLSTLLALCISMALLICRKMQSQSLIPFGPFIAIAGWCTVLYGDFITQWISTWLI